MPTLYEISYDRDSRDFRADFACGLPSIWRRTWADADDAARAELARQRRTTENLAAGEVAQANAEIAAVVAGYEPDAEERAEVAAWLAELEADAVAYSLPAEGLVREALAELARTAEAAGDAHNARALGRAQAMVAAGLYGRVRVAEDGALLVPSQRAGEAPYRVSYAGCPCKAGKHGRPCTHSSWAEGIALAREWAAEELDAAARPLAWAA